MKEQEQIAGKLWMTVVDECNLYIPKVRLRERKLPIMRKTIKIV